MTLVVNKEQVAALTRPTVQRGLDRLNRALWRAAVPIEAMPRADGVGLRLRDGEGRVTQLGWDGLWWTLADAVGEQVAFSQDVYGRVQEARLRGGLALRYDYREQRLSEVRIAGRRELAFRWQGELLEEVELADGRVRRFERDARGKLARVLLDGVAELQLVWDAAGRVAAYGGGNGQLTHVSYDASGRPARLVTSDGGVRVITYGGEGEGHRVTLAIDGELALTVERRGGLATARWADGSVQRFWHLGGRLLAVGNERETIRWRYDPRGLLVREEGGAREVAYDHDRAGALTALRVDGQVIARYGHDEAGRVSAVTAWDGCVVHLAYGDSGMLAEVQHPDGSRWRAAHDALGREREITATSKDGQLFESLRYDYDPLHRVIRQRAHRGAWAYQYDAWGRLTAAQPQGRPVPSWVGPRDAEGNILRYGAVEASYSADHRLVQHGDEVLRYDRWGNLVERAGSAGALRYTYRGRDQLVAVHRSAPGEGGDGALVARYDYDAAGRRTIKQTPTATTRYAWAGGQVVAETAEGEGGTRSERRYLWMPESALLLAMWQDGRRYQVHCDRRLAPICVTDEAGRLVWAAEVDAFGNATLFADGIDFPWRLAGHYLDAETGLHYNVARYYDPHLGRYLSPDPLGVAGGSLNLYLYCDGDPLNRVDPLGLSPLSGALYGAAGSAAAQVIQTGAIADPVGVASGAMTGGATSALVGAMGIKNPVASMAANAVVGPVTSGVVSGLLGRGADATGLAAVGAGVGEALRDLGSSVVGGISSMVSSVGSALGGAVGAIGDAVSGFFGGGSAVGCGESSGGVKARPASGAGGSGSGDAIDALTDTMDELYTPYNGRSPGDMAHSVIVTNEEGFTELLGADGDPANTAAFYAPDLDRMVFRHGGLDELTYAHEGAHYHASDGWNEEMGHWDGIGGNVALEEGYADRIAEQLVGVDDNVYEGEELIAQHVIDQVGEQTMFNAYFGGDTNTLISSYNSSMGDPEAWDKLMMADGETLQHLAGE